MDLFEYQGKQYFARYDIPVSAGDVALTVDEAVAAAEGAGYPVVVKAQVQVGGRGKAGGIKLAADADEVRLHAGNILGMDIKGHLVERLWHGDGYAQLGSMGLFPPGGYGLYPLSRDDRLLLDADRSYDSGPVPDEHQRLLLL